MSRITVHCDIQDMSYTIRGSGRYAGNPSMVFSFGEQDDNYTVKSIKAQMDGFGWTDKLRTNRVPVVYKGLAREGGGTPYDPCFPRYEESIVALDGVLRSHLSVIDCRGIDKPGEELRDVADFYTVRLSQHQIRKYHEGGREEWEWFASQARYDDAAEFIFESEGFKNEEQLKTLQRAYKIPDKSIVLHPPGETIEEVNDDFFEVQEVAKRNEWRINPRVEFLADGGLGSEE